MSIVKLKRVFKLNGIELDDPNPEMTEEEVLSHYTAQYPKLLGGKVIPAVVEGDKLVIELRGVFGDKG